MKHTSERSLWLWNNFRAAQLELDESKQYTLNVTLGKCTWLPGYIILYTTNASNPDAEWTVKGILGEASNATIVGLTPNTYYHFKVF